MSKLPVLALFLSAPALAAPWDAVFLPDGRLLAGTGDGTLGIAQAGDPAVEVWNPAELIGAERAGFALAETDDGGAMLAIGEQVGALAGPGSFEAACTYELEGDTSLLVDLGGGTVALGAIDTHLHLLDLGRCKAKKVELGGYPVAGTRLDDGSVVVAAADRKTRHLAVHRVDPVERTVLQSHQLRAPLTGPFAVHPNGKRAVAQLGTDKVAFLIDLDTGSITPLPTGGGGGKWEVRYIGMTTWLTRPVVVVVYGDVARIDPQPGYVGVWNVETGDRMAWQPLSKPVRYAALEGTVLAWTVPGDPAELRGLVFDDMVREVNATTLCGLLPECRGR